MIYDPTCAAEELRQRILESMTAEELEEYSTHRRVTVEPVETSRICDKCSTTRRIVAMSESQTDLAGKTHWFHYGGNAHCKCPETELNDLDRAAVEKTME